MNAKSSLETEYKQKDRKGKLCIETIGKQICKSIRFITKSQRTNSYERKIKSNEDNNYENSSYTKNVRV